jgi:hypothetical protein
VTNPDFLWGLALVFGPFVVLAIVVGGAAVVVVNRIGRRLDKHAALQRLISLRLDNLHDERAKRHALSLQRRREPPPLSEAQTVEVSEELLLTMRRDPKARRDRQ